MSWSKYFEHHKESVQHPLLERAISIAKQNKLVLNDDAKYALDIGCGTGRDTLFLLQNKYQTTAVDPEQEALNITAARCKDLDLPSPELIQSTLEELHLFRNYDLINSNLALPFVSPVAFNDSWGKLVQHLKIGGIFSGQFFGVKHGWAENPNMTFLTREKINSLFNQPFNIIVLEESFNTATTICDGEQPWHQWDIIAIRID